ncbi:hypothetical protein [Pseudoalteromonas sp. LC2018020214]|uniref:hypothetical protein n=1 Tax=Pseudoalteromonas sp. LC2018020214 TaxID=2799564 RepID=UPI001F3DD075|nr:hypothetical protein [Pseudoalteromonas sp. LC2018020214]
MMKNTHAILLSALCCLTLSACNEQNSQSLEQSNLNDFTLTSSKVSDGGNLPITYTCDGQSISPHLTGVEHLRQPNIMR